MGENKLINPERNKALCKSEIAIVVDEDVISDYDKYRVMVEYSSNRTMSIHVNYRRNEWSMERNRVYTVRREDERMIEEIRGRYYNSEMIYSEIMEVLVGIVDRMREWSNYEKRIIFSKLMSNEVFEFKWEWWKEWVEFNLSKRIDIKFLNGDSY